MLDPDRACSVCSGRIDVVPGVTDHEKLSRMIDRGGPQVVSDLADFVSPVSSADIGQNTSFFLGVDPDRSELAPRQIRVSSRVNEELHFSGVQIGQYLNRFRKKTLLEPVGLQVLAEIRIILFHDLLGLVARYGVSRR